jgi:homocitrate synthase NifV
MSIGRYPLPARQACIADGSPEEAADYPEISRFVCRKSGRLASPLVISEIQINDIREISLLSQYSGLKNIRITGLDDVLCYDYISAYEKIKKQLRGRIEFCPENSLDCATAAAVEWVMNGGINIVTAFGESRKRLS